MNSRLKQRRVALITGGTNGLGKLTATILSEKDWDLAINGRKWTSELESWLQSLKTDREGHSEFFQANVMNQAEATLLVENVYRQFGRIDVLIHAVGPFIRERKLFYEHSLEEVEKMITGNLLSALWTVHTVLPHMRHQRWGRIILFGFGRAGEAPSWPDRSVYAAAKTGLVSFTKTLAVEEAPYGITVNMVCPGDIVGEKKEWRIQDVVNLTDKETPRGRPGSGEDVARVIDFLCQDASDFVTGNIINVTGGLDVIHPVSKKHDTFS
ncbi:SDR family oxidoreductase [Thermoflavimicrobium daqui]|jgi:3-oxoacyl-[acyl-carrier protein] reductase|uniref:3-oxoacyl-ACP reductase n=1 Tax=Thermoflavimicrobium daqui TaxID=2137476 RepID=A0A364K9P1_9BACL|nr:SDR family oxidoreductase [Thermoflavimicrobium daqui]RAL26998.1 3-oxoacyl-ACP reductase [Thermoflavimicrobium daqui]